MKTKTNKHAQPRIKGSSRIPRSFAILPELDWAVEMEARKWGVSKSWVSARAHAEMLNIRLPWTADYRNRPWKNQQPGRVVPMRRKA